MNNFHPIADIFPMMPEAELAKLAEDIRENGLREPIWTDQAGRIIDGRNRFLACQQVAVEPIYRPYEGDEAGLPAFVISLNLHRRHLKESQRALIAGRVANWANGTNQHTSEGGSIDTTLSNDQAAEMLNVSAPSVKRAKTVLKEGTPEEIKAVEAGDAAVSTTARNVRARKKEEAPAAAAKPNNHKVSGPRVTVPEGETLEGVAREVMRRTDQGETLEQVAADFKIASSNLRAARDIVLLTDRDDLSESDAKTATAALAEMNETQRAKAPHESIRPIVERIWGNKGQREKAEHRRRDDFERGFGTLTAACFFAEKMEIPHLPEDRRKQALEELQECQRHLTNLKKRIEV